jgi:hypothetical protein
MGLPGDTTISQLLADRALLMQFIQDLDLIDLSEAARMFGLTAQRLKVLRSAQLAREEFMTSAGITYVPVSTQFPPALTGYGAGWPRWEKSVIVEWGIATGRLAADGVTILRKPVGRPRITRYMVEE